MLKMIVGEKLFDCFPDLPQRWFCQKGKQRFHAQNFAFTSWEQRPYLSRSSCRPVTSGMEFMCQDLTLMPIKNSDGEVDKVCIVVFDATDNKAIYRTMHSGRHEKLEMVSRIDGLTQLFNRSHWQSRLSENPVRAARYSTRCADHVRPRSASKVNDTYHLRW